MQEAVHAAIVGGMAHYAVSWQNGGGSFEVGRLDLGTHGIRLEGGRHRSGRLAVKNLLYRDVVEATMASRDQRLHGRPTIELQGRHGSILVAPIGAGLAREILGALQKSMESEALER